MRKFWYKDLLFEERHKEESHLSLSGPTDDFSINIYWSGLVGASTNES